jgi:hypothetical protein
MPGFNFVLVAGGEVKMWITPAESFYLVEFTKAQHKLAVMILSPAVPFTKVNELLDEIKELIRDGPSGFSSPRNKNIIKGILNIKPVKRIEDCIAFEESLLSFERVIDVNAYECMTEHDYNRFLHYRRKALKVTEEKCLKIGVTGQEELKAFYQPAIQRRCGACNEEVKEKAVCSECKVQHYCNARCQKQHWSRHKFTCGVSSVDSAKSE